MALLRQTLAAARIGIAGLHQRIWSSLVIVLSMACVVGMLLGMLSFTEGLMRTYQNGGSPGRAVVVSSRAPDEYGCDIPRSKLGTILDAPGISKASDGHDLADPESITFLPPPRASVMGTVIVRGIRLAGVALRPGFRIVSGRLFRSGRQELVIGTLAAQRLHLKVGDSITMPDGKWPVVGVFSTRGRVDSEVLGDLDAVSSTTRSTCLGSVLVKLTSPRAIDEMSQWLRTNPTLAVTAERQSDYYHRTAARDSAYFTAVAYLVAAIMAIGALFGSVKVLYASVDARRMEIATLRAVGYQAVPLGLSVTVESLLLSLLGAFLGAACAWLLVNGRHRSTFDLVVSWGLVGLGFGWAVLLALLGALPSAFRAAKLSPADALKRL